MRYNDVYQGNDALQNEIAAIKSLRPSDAYMRQYTKHHSFG